MPPTRRVDASQLRRAEPAERAKQADLAYARIKQLILDGTLPAGAQMLEQEAAIRLGMSRTPVREAMVRLAQQGMVELRPRHGMRVLPVASSDMAEIYTVLTALEGAAAELVAKRGLTARQLGQLRGAVADMERALEAGDLIAWAAADELFHLRLVELSGNARLAQMVGQLWDQAHRARMLTLQLRPKPIHSVVEHAALVDAIAAGDPGAAKAIHEDHRRRAGAMLVDLLDRLGLTQL